MAEFIDFAFRHWYLFVALFVILGMLIGGEMLRKIRGITALNPMQALQLINHQDAVVIDVRDAAEFKTGHLPDARHVPMSELGQRLKELNKFKEKPVILYCRTDTRASSAGKKKKKEGFTSVHTLQGGLTAWQSANLPLSKSKK